MSVAPQVVSDDRRVSNLELFTDLVFVFAITQLTALLVHDPTPRGVLEVLLIFGVLWWMFGGYVWLTNAVAPDRKVRRLLLLAAMIGFLIVALAIPTAFHGGGIVFGLGMLIVIGVHATLFVYASGVRRVDLLRFIPGNFLGAGLLVLAGTLQGTIAYVLFGLTLGLQVLGSILSRNLSYEIRAGHFVERHGLLILIVLGESIIAIGVGAGGLPLDASLLTAAVLALATTSALWWLYFAGDDQRAAAALESAPAGERVRIALAAFFYSAIPMLLGVVAFATGVEATIAHAFAPLKAEVALALAVGATLYLVGDVLFRLSIGHHRTAGRGLAAFACLAGIPVGIAVSGLAEMATILGILVVLMVVEEVGARRIATAPGRRALI